MFSREWAYESSEGAEGKSFWDGIIYVLGITCGRVAFFEIELRMPHHFRELDLEVSENRSGKGSRTKHTTINPRKD